MICSPVLAKCHGFLGSCHFSGGELHERYFFPFFTKKCQVVYACDWIHVSWKSRALVTLFKVAVNAESSLCSSVYTNFCPLFSTLRAHFNTSIDLLIFHGLDMKIVKKVTPRWFEPSSTSKCTSRSRYWNSMEILLTHAQLGQVTKSASLQQSPCRHNVIALLLNLYTSFHARVKVHVAPVACCSAPRQIDLFNKSTKCQEKRNNARRCLSGS